MGSLSTIAVCQVVPVSRDWCSVVWWLKSFSWLMWLLRVLSLKRPKRSPVFGTTGLFTRAQKEKPTWMAAASEGNAKAKKGRF